MKASGVKNVGAIPLIGDRAPFTLLSLVLLAISIELNIMFYLISPEFSYVIFYPKFIIIGLFITIFW